jgi:rhamnosyltransferase
VIDRATFNHGGTRHWARSLVTADVLVYMTQDAIPAHPEALSRLVEPLTDPSVAVAYGRQLARPGSGPLEAFPRLFNYPDRSEIKSKADLTRLGMKTFFCSNSFCAYRTDAWDAAGGFPNRVLISEDHYLTARLLMAGYKVAYVAEAQVHHSHHYTLLDEFRRYFDHGAFLRTEAWMRELAGEVEGEGFRLVREQAAYLWRAGQAHLIPYSLLAAVVKYTGYRVGYLEPHLPRVLARHLSRQPYFWRESRRKAGAEPWRHLG